MSRFTPLLFLAPALMLSACGTYNGGVESANQPVVQRTDYLLDLRTDGYALAPGEPERLAGWMAAMDLRYGDRVAVDDGQGGATAREDVAALASHYGLFVADRAPVTVGQIAPGTVRVVITRMIATVPSCPDHSREYTPDFSQSTSSNYGCATNSNLAKMIADPADLVRGAPGSPTTDPVTGGKAVNALRGAKPSGGGGTTLPSAGGSSK
jgi:pilus assembly protein CpaD